jgi:hypothetical protein
MGEPALVNRTGTFAEGVKAIKIIDGVDGVPIIDYTYDKFPYQIFEVGRGKSPWATPERDPTTIINRTIREIAAQLFVNKLATRRL